MSYKTMAAAATAKNIKPTDKLVLLILAFHHNEQTGECFPSVPTIASECGLSENPVRDAIKRLEAGGIIRTSWKPSPHGAVRAFDFAPLQNLNPFRFRTPSESEPLQNLNPTPSESEPLPLQNLNPNRELEQGKEQGIILSEGQAPRKKSSPKKFIPPTVEEVQAFIAEKGFTWMDATEFVDFYAVNDWHDSRGNPVLSWKQKMITRAKMSKPCHSNPIRRPALDDGTPHGDGSYIRDEQF